MCILIKSIGAWWGKISWDEWFKGDEHDQSKLSESF